jgi:hypothetical protein
MGLFRKKKEEPIPQSLSMLPVQKPFSNEELDDDLIDDEEEEEDEEEEPEELPRVKPIERPKEVVKEIAKIEPVKEETEDDIDIEQEKIRKKLEELDKKKLEIAEKKKKEQESVPDANIQERLIAAWQNHEMRLRDLEASFYRVKGSI